MGERVRRRLKGWPSYLPNFSTTTPQVKIDGSKGFMKPPQGYGCYAGVGDRGILGAPIPGLDLTIMDMRPGGARRVIIPPALAFGARGVGGVTGSKIPPNSVIFVEVELVDLGDEPVMDPDQLAFLRYGRSGSSLCLTHAHTCSLTRTHPPPALPLTHTHPHTHTPTHSPARDNPLPVDRLVVAGPERAVVADAGGLGGGDDSGPGAAPAPVSGSGGPVVGGGGAVSAAGDGGPSANGGQGKQAETSRAELPPVAGS